uniref:Uncharacterized protein n=1 Tax=Panagrolaimus superbus TaxID=310955 RepID=A0A914YJE3_9BILA
MDSSKSDASNALSLKELLFMKSNNSIAERVKNFLPQIAKANAELEEADEETRQSMIFEQIEQLQDDSSSSDESDSSEDEDDPSTEDEKEKDKIKGGDHVEIVFTKFEERETHESSSSDEEEKKANEDDFIIRKSDKSASK